MSLDDVITRLRDHAAVVAVALLGSAARGELTPTSDIDLLVVTQAPDARPGEPFEAVYTLVARRPTDVIITTTGAIERLVANDWNAPLAHPEEALLRWIATRPPRTTATDGRPSGS